MVYCNHGYCFCWRISGINHVQKQFIYADRLGNPAFRRIALFDYPCKETNAMHVRIPPLPEYQSMKCKAPSPVLASFILAIAAGIFIGIGGTVLLSLENRIVGSVLFSVALLSICMLGLYLFTGKVGYLVNSHTRTDILSVIAGLLGNGVGCWLAAAGARICRPAVIDAARALVEPKLQKDAAYAFVAGIFCGILMYTAVQIFKDKNSAAGIFFCVPVFILAGFEHSIADMFYFFCAGEYSPEMFAFLLLVVLGNAVGGWLMPLFSRLAGKK